MANPGVRMFGTPPEPLFNNDVCGVTREMLQEWVDFLIEENYKHVENATPDVVNQIGYSSYMDVFLLFKLFNTQSQLLTTLN